VGAVRRYAGILPTFAVVVVTLALFVGFFFAWLVAPLLALLLFYVVFVFAEERWALFPSLRGRVAKRRERLKHEAVARRELLRREEHDDG
jgi:predicted DNA repair protein MutK